MITFHGPWQIRVITKSALFDQRLVVRTPTGTVIIPGNDGASRVIDEPTWSLSPEHNHWGRGWRTNIRLTPGPVTAHASGGRSQELWSTDWDLDGHDPNRRNQTGSRPVRDPPTLPAHRLRDGHSTGRGPRGGQGDDSPGLPCVGAARAGTLHARWGLLGREGGIVGRWDALRIRHRPGVRRGQRHLPRVRTDHRRPGRQPGSRHKPSAESDDASSLECAIKYFRSSGAVRQFLTILCQNSPRFRPGLHPMAADLPLPRMGPPPRPQFPCPSRPEPSPTDPTHPQPPGQGCDSSRISRPVPRKIRTNTLLRARTRRMKRTAATVADDRIFTDRHLA
ncbi:hypothetical protein QFZ82_000256 [Streptomyces sp. V4I23]|nr:hypothetical protein [Streptomyces sp. V4I23]